jgi:hypothetical protein
VLNRLEKTKQEKQPNLKAEKEVWVEKEGGGVSCMRGKGGGVGQVW